jgi:hypothetical protein
MFAGCASLAEPIDVLDDGGYGDVMSALCGSQPRSPHSEGNALGNARLHNVSDTVLTLDEVSIQPDSGIELAGSYIYRSKGEGFGDGFEVPPDKFNRPGYGDYYQAARKKWDSLEPLPGAQIHPDETFYPVVVLRPVSKGKGTITSYVITYAYEGLSVNHIIHEGMTFDVNYDECDDNTSDQKLIGGE